MARSCSSSASASGTAGEDAESRPAVVSLAHLLQGPDAAPPDYLTLSLTPAGEPWPRRKQPGEVTLKHIDAPRDYLKLSVAPSDEDEASSVPGDTSSGAAETIMLPPKKRKLAPYVCHETVASSSRSLALAIVTHGDDNVSRSSRAHGKTPSPGPEAMATEPIDAVPLQAVYYDHARMASHLLRLRHGGARKITRNDAASTSGSAVAAPFSAEPIDAVPLRAAPRRYILLAADAIPTEPAWIRTTLGLPAGLRLSFITQKRIERSDLDLQQSRLLIPGGDVARLLPLLTEDGRRAANLDKPWTRQKRQASGNHSDSSEEKKARAQGKKHGGLVVPVYVNHAGDRMNAELTRWTSNGNTVLKFGSHRSFVDVGGLQVMDEIQMWAFRQDDGGLMCLVISKI
ncbi:hypothetical protein CFC21_032339 [Triticum aestivum]|uniref:TF-B3 domain-containing protein n=2 Tax=Triticum aestivum TaxID=4565 RepID=A0A9R1JIW8_WHEAT|nr:hypothetical protein CFC21_009081 [Triticum aestivum]KAF7019135.1 hypothetical protein CFC21_032339 [Triticum aestivum]